MASTDVKKSYFWTLCRIFLHELGVIDIISVHTNVATYACIATLSANAYRRSLEQAVGLCFYVLCLSALKKSVGVAHVKNNMLQILCPAIYQTGSQAPYFPSNE